MERQIADGTLQKWESPTVTEIRVSAEVTAYAAIWRVARRPPADDPVEGLIGRVGASVGIGCRRRVSAMELHLPPLSRGADRLAALRPTLPVVDRGQR